MSVKAVGQASALHRTDSGTAAPGGSGQQQSTAQAEIQKAVGARLACAMHEDWRAAIGQHSKTDGAAKSARPMTTTEFNRRWAAVCDIIEGRCVPRPDRINSHRAES